MLKYDCFSALLEFGGVNGSFWNDRDGIEKYFWASANSIVKQWLPCSLAIMVSN